MRRQRYFWIDPVTGTRLWLDDASAHLAHGRAYPRTGPQKRGRPWRTRENVVLLLQRCVADRGGPISQREFNRLSGVSRAIMGWLFPGGWRELLQEANVPPVPRGRAIVYTDEFLLADLHRLILALGRWPTWHEITRDAVASRGTYERRFGNRTQLRAHYEQLSP